MDEQTLATFPVELDVREMRSLHLAASLVTEALLEAGCKRVLPDDRKVMPAESALMKLEMALVMAGEDE